MNGRLSNQRTLGLTLVEVLISIAAVVVLAGILLPALAKSKTRGNYVTCISNIRQLGLAMRMFSQDHEDKFPWATSVTNGGTLEYSTTTNVFLHYLALSNELSSPKVLHCSKDTQRPRASSWEQLTNNSFLSYFAGLDADSTNPNSQSILCGDRNMTTNGRPAIGLVRFTTNLLAGWTGTLHANVGTIGLSDGSAQYVSSRAFNLQFAAVTNAIVQLAIP